MAQAVEVPEQYLATHHVLVEDFSNATSWPKHLLIQYTWHQLEPMHAQAGLYALFVTGGHHSWWAATSLYVGWADSRPCK